MIDNILNNSSKDGFISFSCFVIYMKTFKFKSAVYTCLVYYLGYRVIEKI